MIELSSVEFVVDDDGAIRAAMSRLVAAVARAAQRVVAARELLSLAIEDAPACLVFDLRMPRNRGTDLQRESTHGQSMPIIFITGDNNDVSMNVRAIAAGGFEYPSKPLGDRALLDAIQSVVTRAQDARREHAQNSQLRARLEQLTPREKQVFELVIEGRLNKQIAGELGISEVTVKIHRARVMQKMRADSLAELVRMGSRLGLSTTSVRK